MQITRRTAAASSGNNTTSCTVVIPAAVQANDMLVLDVVNRDATANVSVADNEGAGSWTRKTTVNATTNGSGQLWWKRASANTASKTITVSGATGSVACVVTPYVGVTRFGDPFGTPVGESNASGNETQAQITTVRNNSWVHHAVACTSNDTLNPGDRTATSPAALTESGEGTSSGGSDCSVSAASAEKATAGATGAISWAQTDGTGASYAVELFAALDTLTADTAAFTWTGTAATLKDNRRLIADGGSFAWTGTDATLRRSFPLLADPGSFAWTGTAATLRYARIFTAASGSYAWTGTAAGTKFNRKIGADSGAFAWSGTDATLTYEEQAQEFTLDAEPGAFVWTGTAAGLRFNRKTIADAGSYTWTGTAADLAYEQPTIYTLEAGAGLVAWGGTSTTLKFNRKIVCEDGEFEWSGSATTLTLFHPPPTRRKHRVPLWGTARVRAAGVGWRRVRRVR